MKKIISIFTILCMLLVTFVPFVSASSDNVNIISVTYTANGDEFVLDVKGTSAENTNVSLVVKNQNSVIRAIEQTKTDNDGNFEYQIGIEITADKGLQQTPDQPLEYTIYARNYKGMSKDFNVKLYSNEAKQSIVDDFFNKADVDAMLEYIDSYNEIFGFSMTYYDAMRDAIASNMVALKDVEPFTLANIAQSFDKAVAVSYLFVEDAGADRTSFIEYPLYSSLLGFDKGFGDADSLYPVYKAMTDDEKKVVNKIVFAAENKKFDFVELKEEFFMAIVAERFADYSDDFTTVAQFIGNYNKWFGLEDFENLTDLELSSILSDLSNEKIPDNKADFAKLYKKYYDEVKDAEDVKKPVTNGGGGGAGGGAGGSISTGIGEMGYEPSKEEPKTEAEPEPEKSVTFKDLEGYAWASDAINYLAKNNVVNGKADGVFAPADNITREEFAKIVVLAFDLYGENAKCNFSDVEDDRWSYQYIATLHKYGVVQGYPNGTFGVKNLITREDMAVMLYRVLLVKLSIDVNDNNGKTFKDMTSIADYALNSVRMLSAKGVISGDDQGNFNPKKGATRAETCQMIYNCVAKEGGNK